MSYDINAARLANIAGDNATAANKSSIAAQTQATIAAQFANAAAEKDQQAEALADSMMQNIAKGLDIHGNVRSDGPTTHSGTFTELSKGFGEAGFSKRSLDFMTAADKSQEAEQKLEADSVVMQQNKLENTQKTTAIVANALAGAAPDGSNWEDIRASLLNHPGFSDEDRIHLDKMPKEYSKEFIDSFQEQAMTAAQRATFDMQSSNTEWRQKQAEAANARADRAEARAKASAAETRRWHDRIMGGSAGITANAPNPKEQNDAKQVIVNQIYKGVAPPRIYDGKADDEALSVGALNIASRAKQIIKDDPSCSWPQALIRATTESQNNNEWTDSTYHDTFMDKPYGEAKVDPKASKIYKPKASANSKTPGDSKDNAIPIPRGKDGSINTDNMRPGLFYIIDGEVQQAQE